MKPYALLAALAFAVPTESMADHRHHGGVVVVGRFGGYGGCYPRYSYARPFSYSRPYVYGGYYGGYSPYYYGGYPSVSFSYTSVPSTTYYRSAPSSSYSNGSSLEADVQRELRRLGYYDGSIDGDIGPASRSAIRAYQNEHGLDPTGRIDARTLRALGL